MIFTKEAGCKMIEMWPNFTTKEISEAIGCPIQDIYTWTKQLREMGADLPTKTRGNATYRAAFMEQLITEQKAGQILPINRTE